MKQQLALRGGHIGAGEKISIAPILQCLPDTTLEKEGVVEGVVEGGREKGALAVQEAGRRR